MKSLLKNLDARKSVFGFPTRGSEINQVVLLPNLNVGLKFRIFKQQRFVNDHGSENKGADLQLIYVIVFAFAKSRIFHDEAHLLIFYYQYGLYSL